MDWRFSAKIRTALGGSVLLLGSCTARDLRPGAYGSGSGGDPTGGDPTGGDPTGGDPTGGDPTGGDPTGGEPTGGEPTGGDPTGGDPHDGPPQLIGARFIDANTVRLKFSEPVTPTASVDPAQFRLSIGVSQNWGGYHGEPNYEGTSYRDAGYASTQYCYEYCDYHTGECYEYCWPIWEVDDKVQAVSLTQVDADELDLTLKPAVAKETCDFMKQIGSYGYVDDIDMFTHYSNNGGAIQDQDGEALQVIAEHWVITPNHSSYVEGHFPKMDPYIPIPCPF